MYYDPVLDYNQPGGLRMGLTTAFYILPQDRELAREIYEAWVKANDLRGEPDIPLFAEGDRTSTSVVPNRELSKPGLLLAQEFGDELVASRLRTLLDIQAEPKHFGEDDSEFGFFSHLGEEWPRGQSSALHMCAEVMSEGAWHRTFNRSDWRERFSQPTVQGVDFPTLGLSVARNDLDAGALLVKTYAATPAAEGQATSFDVVQLGSSVEGLQVTRDGEPFDGWSRSDEGCVTVSTTVGDYSFVFHHGLRGEVGSGSTGARL
eukprot:COSAG04_NODE_615_length_11914_cov_12.688447_8_plen_262_part_00